MWPARSAPRCVISGAPRDGRPHEPGAAAFRAGAGRDHRFGRQAVGFQPPEKIIPRPHRNTIDILRRFSLTSAHPIKEALDFIAKRFVTAALKFDDRDIRVGFEISIKLCRVASHFIAIELTTQEIPGDVRRVFSVASDELVGGGMIIEYLRHGVEVKGNGQNKDKP